MPDIIDILVKRGKLIALITLAATILAAVISLLRPKEYLATVTALPANSALVDKARIFNNNIEGLYSELGSPDELDRIEGTAKLDTVYLAVAEKANLVRHYKIKDDSMALYKAARKLKTATDIRRSAYGELKIKLWDSEPVMAAQLANAVLQQLNEIHQHVHRMNTTRILHQLKKGWVQKQIQLDSLVQSRNYYATGSDTVTGRASGQYNASDTTSNPNFSATTDPTILREQILEYQKIIGQYELALSTTIQPLIVVEHARPALRPDKPKLWQTIAFAFGASFLFSFLLAVLIDSRKRSGV